MQSCDIQALTMYELAQVLTTSGVPGLHKVPKGYLNDRMEVFGPYTHPAGLGQRYKVGQGRQEGENV